MESNTPDSNADVVPPSAQRHNQLRNVIPATIELEEHVLFWFTSSMICSYNNICPYYLRRLIEFGFLLIALFFLMLLSYVHLALDRSIMPCVMQISSKWPSDGIIRVEIIDSPMASSRQHTLHNSYVKELGSYYDGGVHNSSTPSTVSAFSLNESLPILDKYNSEHVCQHQTMASVFGLTEPSMLNLSNVPNSKASYKAVVWNRASPDHMDNVWYNMDLPLFESYHIIELTKEYGFLHLKPPTRKKLNITVTFEVFDVANTNSCLSELSYFSRFVLTEVVGLDYLPIVMLKSMVRRQHGTFFARNIITGDHLKMQPKSPTNMSSTGVICLVLSIASMCSFSLLTCLVLRFAHRQVLVCITASLRSIETTYSIFQLLLPFVPLAIVVEALVGVETIIGEYFGDSTLAFYIILMTWCADQFYTLCCHSPATRRYWPRFFYLYLATFYVYHHRFRGELPRNFSGLALLTTWMFVQHSMIYALHHCEIESFLSARRRRRSVLAGSNAQSPGTSNVTNNDNERQS